MAEYHVGCGAFGIYAGILEKNKKYWKYKSCVTDEAIEAVRDYMVENLCGFDSLDDKRVPTGGWQWTMNDGRVVELRVTIKESEADKKSVSEG